MKKILILFTILLLIICNVNAQEKFDWSSLLYVPPQSDVSEGNQILHFKSKNKHFSENEESRRFVETFLKKAVPLESDAEVLRFASDAVVIQGAYLEMGVCTGKTINFIAALNPHKKIYGFDSFLGLPEDWIRSDFIIPQGTFGFKTPFLPPVLHNVVLFPGWFNEVLPIFKNEILKSTPIALLHIDCDIYSSTVDVFAFLGDHITDGTVIVFDELYNYPGYENHEFKAFMEFLEKQDFDVEYLAYNIYHEQVAVKIKVKTPLAFKKRGKIAIRKNRDAKGHEKGSRHLTLKVL